MATSDIEPVVALVVAAGSGTRLGADVPKALVEVRGRSLVARSIDALAAGGCTHAVVVIAPGLRDAFERSLSGCPIPVAYALGGAERQDSVRHGLDVIASDPVTASSSIVLVHDAARAFVPPAVVARVIEAVDAGADAVIPVVPVVDSIRQVGADGSQVVDRATLRAVQTPQGFRCRVLEDAHAHVAREGLTVTDDAAACEAIGIPVVLVEGSRDAFKVTEPRDLALAATMGERP